MLLCTRCASTLLHHTITSLHPPSFPPSLLASTQAALWLPHFPFSQPTAATMRPRQPAYAQYALCGSICTCTLDAAAAAAACIPCVQAALASASSHPSQPKAQPHGPPASCFTAQQRQLAHRKHRPQPSHGLHIASTGRCPRTACTSQAQAAALLLRLQPPCGRAEGGPPLPRPLHRALEQGAAAASQLPPQLLVGHQHKVLGVDGHLRITRVMQEPMCARSALSERDDASSESALLGWKRGSRSACMRGTRASGGAVASPKQSIIM